MNVHYGCGFSSCAGWENFDASPTLRLERIPLIGAFVKKNSGRFPSNVKYGDIVRGLPVKNDSAELVYCSHVLEHLSLADLKIALINTYKILKKGGVFRLVLPDLEYEARKYIDNPDCNASVDFLKRIILGEEKRDRGIIKAIVNYAGNSRHLWMWDYKSLKLELEKCGFQKVRRAYYNDNENMHFVNIEEKSRWDNCLGLECVK